MRVVGVIGRVRGGEPYASHMSHVNSEVHMARFSITEQHLVFLSPKLGPTGCWFGSKVQRTFAQKAGGQTRSSCSTAFSERMAICRLSLLGSLLDRAMQLAQFNVQLAGQHWRLNGGGERIRVRAAPLR